MTHGPRPFSVSIHRLAFAGLLLASAIGCQNASKAPKSTLPKILPPPKTVTDPAGKTPQATNTPVRIDNRPANTANAALATAGMGEFSLPAPVPRQGSAVFERGQPAPVPALNGTPVSYSPLSSAPSSGISPPLGGLKSVTPPEPTPGMAAAPIPTPVPPGGSSILAPSMPNLDAPPIGGGLPPVKPLAPGS